MSGTIYHLGEATAVRGVLQGVAGFAGAADIQDQSPNGWLAIVPDAKAGLSLLTAKEEITVRIALPGASVSGDPAPEELLISAVDFADAIRLAESLDKQPVVTLNGTAVDVAGIMAMQTYAERPGPKVGSVKGKQVVAQIPTDRLADAMDRSIKAIAPKKDEPRRKLAPYVAFVLDDETVSVVATDGYTVSVVVIDGVKGIPEGTLKLVGHSRTFGSAIANLKGRFGDEIALAVDNIGDPGKVILSGGDAEVVVTLVDGDKHPATQVVDNFRTKIDPTKTVAAIMGTEEQLRGWIKPFMKAGTELVLSATPAGGGFESAGDTPAGQVPHKLTLPAGSVASRGVAQAIVSTDYFRKAVGAVFGKAVDFTEDSDDDSSSAGAIELALMPFPGASQASKTLGVYARNLGIPGVQVYVAGILPVAASGAVADDETAAA